MIEQNDKPLIQRRFHVFFIGNSTKWSNELSRKSSNWHKQWQSIIVVIFSWTSNSHISINYSRTNSIWWSRQLTCLSYQWSQVHFIIISAIQSSSEQTIETWVLISTFRVEFESSALIRPVFYNGKRVNHPVAYIILRKEAKRVFSLIRDRKILGKVEVQIVDSFNWIYLK